VSLTREEKGNGMTIAFGGKKRKKRDAAIFRKKKKGDISKFKRKGRTLRDKGRPEA